MPAAYTAADGIKGGSVYSEWFSTEAEGTGLAAAGVTVSSEFVRCKSCHGWDGLGTLGSYANRTGQSTGALTRPDVASSNLRTILITASFAQLQDLVVRTGARPLNSTDNAHPDFTVLSPGQRWNLIKFMREEWVRPGELYDLAVTGEAMHYEYPGGVETLIKPTLTYSNVGKNGDAAAGQTLFAAKCASCHGTDGKQIRLDKSAFSGVGAFLRAKPNESWFKMKFGVSGSTMKPGLVTSTVDLKNLYKALVDLTAFPD